VIRFYQNKIPTLSNLYQILVECSLKDVVIILLKQNISQYINAGVTYGEVAWELILFNPRALDLNETLALFNISFEPQTMLIFIVITMLTVLLSTGISLWYVLRLEPKKILL